MKRIAMFLALMLCLLMPTLAQDALAPAEVAGVAVYVPFPLSITLDGDLSDWAGVPFQTVTGGPSPSPVAGENDAFRFGLASDGTLLYVAMTMNDQNIITGQHGMDFWNEDSLEFYLNFTGNYGLESYQDGVYQFNLNPGDIGKPAGSPLTVTGSNAARLPVSGVVFATETGWGIEVSVPLPAEPVHGGEFGFQAHANGATRQNRDVKLIWSANDTQDQSYMNPSKFGRALFYQIGQTDQPMPSEVVIVKPERVVLALNQLGYLPDAPKWAVYAREARIVGRPYWLIRDAVTGESVLAGASVPSDGPDAASGDVVYRIDFSALTASGRYVLEIDGQRSAPFEVSETVYSGLALEALRYFYRTRSGIELLAAYAGADYARAAGHLSDADVTCWAGQADGKTFEPCGYRLNAVGGWYDAGDYGKYVVNGGISAWTLLNLHERMPQAYPDGAVGLPESGAGIPDVLSEARWQVDWMMRMQVPEGYPQAGMVHHKLHETVWSGLPLMPETNVDNSHPTHGRYLMPPSTAATLNMAASAAQAARLWASYDPDWAAQALSAAERAWQAAKENPVFTYGNIPGAGGGNYDDANVTDEFFWAAAELYLTTGNAVYRDELLASPFGQGQAVIDPRSSAAMYWGDVSALGAVSLLSVQNDLPAELMARWRDELIAAADEYLLRIETEGYGVPLRLDQYDWGSNSSVLNNGLILAVAHDLTGEARYADGALETLNYVLGRNANGLSFVTGYGAAAAQHPHHRFWANRPDQGYPAPPPGVVVGGPNVNPSDPIAMEKVSDNPPARRYIDHLDSYSTNEVAINWNAPLAWMAAYFAR
jgi:endoglucanase